MSACSVPAVLQLEEIIGEVESDGELQKLIGKMKNDSSLHPDYTLVHVRLLRQDKLAIPPESRFIGLILKEFHDRKMAGHGGVVKTHKHIAESILLVRNDDRYQTFCYCMSDMSKAEILHSGS